MLDPFYPVVPDSGWVARLVAAGTQADPAAHQGPARSRAPPAGAGGQGGLRRCAAPSSSSTTIGRSAIDEGCDFVHLGQEDLWTPT